MATESKTLGAKTSTRFTDRLTIRMDPHTKTMLKALTSKTGITECQLIHALLTAYFYGVGDKLDLDVKSPTINLTIERQVMRVRRYGREVEVEKVRIEKSGSPERCAYGCEGPVVAVHNVYAGADLCTRTFVCAKHHERLKRSSAGWGLLE